MPDALPRYVSAHEVAAALRMPYRELAPLLREHGVRVLEVRIRGRRPRVRVNEDDLHRMFAELERAPYEDVDRARLAVQMTLGQIGRAKRQYARRSAGEVPTP